MRTNRLRAIGVLALTIALAACDPTRMIGPENQLEVSNAPGIFEWQVTDLRDVAQTLTYVWQNPGTTANVNQASSVSRGTATLTVRDASGTQVYSRDLAENGTFGTALGPAGNWTVVVTLDGVHGTLNFRLDTP
jgi:hypothetical protein